MFAIDEKLSVERTRRERGVLRSDRPAMWWDSGVISPSESPSKALVSVLAPPNIRRVEARVQLVLRAEADLNSKRKGELPRGQCLVLLDEITDPSGVVRARVAKESSPRGVRVLPLGWVTAVKDGEQKLMPVEDGIGSASTRGGSPSTRRLPGSPSTRTGDDTSMAARIAMRRRQNANDREEQRKLQAASTTEATPPPESAPTSASEEPSFHFVWMESSALRAQLDGLNATIAFESGVAPTTLDGKIGKYLFDKKVSLDGLIAEWDRNKVLPPIFSFSLCLRAVPSCITPNLYLAFIVAHTLTLPPCCTLQDGDINRTEFRMNVRKLDLGDGKPAEIPECDVVFDAFDADKCARRPRACAREFSLTFPHASGLECAS